MSAQTMKASSPFEGVLDRFFEQRLEHNPMLAAYSGLRSGEGKLGKATREFVGREEAFRQRALRDLESISPGDLTPEQHLDRLALRSLLLRESNDFARNRPTLDPSAPDQLMSILLHALMRAEDEPKRAAANLVSLLREAPRFLDEAASLIDRPERVWLKIMQQSIAGADTLLSAVGTFLQKTRSERPQLLASAKKALERYKAHVESRPVAAEGSYAVGPDELQQRITTGLGLDYTLGQIETLALREVERVGALLKKACAKFGKNKSPEDIIATERERWRPGKPLLDLYREETTRIADRFRETDAVTFPEGDRLDVKPVPEFMRPLFPTAAYSSPGAFEKTQKGIFWVNDLSVTKRDPKEKLREQQQHFGLSLTCAHEAYPGHHLQFVTANRHPRKWRRLFAHAVFYEGWTLWCEQMMVDLRIDRSPWLQVQQLHDALWRCHRILVDLRLQTRRYTYHQAVRHMQKHLGFTRARAEGDVNWYTGSPSVPMSYWLGRLENDRLRRKLIDGRGWTLKQFNDWLISFGTVPQAWIEKYGLN
jgi:uncharacterized protein (DUF885 family)